MSETSDSPAVSVRGIPLPADSRVLAGDSRRQPMTDSARQIVMLTRRDLLRSLGLAGTAAAVPTLLSGCGRAQPHDGPAPVRPSGGQEGAIALANVSRSTGGQAAQPQSVSAVQAFTADLYGRLATEPGNVVCSPYSVAVALAMTLNGARGRTAAEMQSVLHAPGMQRFNEGLNSLTRLMESRAGEVTRADGSTGRLSLDVANSLWGQQGVRWERPFLEALARYYGTGMRLVDYVTETEASRLRINAWTAAQTHDKIPEIIPPGVLDLMTRLVLVNAIYLKAPWETPFNAHFTKSQQFTRGDGSHVDADMMVGELGGAAFGTGRGWRSVRLPYAGEKLAMTIVVPDGSLAGLERSLDAPALVAMLTAKGGSETFELHLPRWQFRLASALTEPLQTLGMPTAFDSAHADLSGMTTERQLYIQAVLHEAFISVDEEGTEAAAASAVIVGETSAHLPPPVFDVDRPFLFVIHDVETATPLFIGRVDDPTAT